MAESGEDKLLRGANENPGGEHVTTSNKSSDRPQDRGNPKVGDPGQGAAIWHGSKDPMKSA